MLAKGELLQFMTVFLLLCAFREKPSVQLQIFVLTLARLLRPSFPLLR